MLSSDNDTDRYVVLCLELGVLGLAELKPYGCDVTAPVDGIEFFQSLDHDEFTIIGEFNPIVND